MIKLYINDRRIFICSVNERVLYTDLQLNIDKFFTASRLREIVQSFEDQQHLKSLTLQCEDPDLVWATLKNLYKIMNAAGGIVQNEKGEILMIFRNERWDLPKGKVEAGEEMDAAALREVEEECGIHQLNLIKPGQITYHTYPYGDDRILKCTYWFHMKCNDPEHIKPQLEEGITEVRWMNKADVQMAAGHSYASIVNLLSEEGII